MYPGRLFSLVALFWLISSYCLAQSQTKLPALDFIPQEPATAAFSRYGDIPVDLSTGVPQIQIPLYTLKAGHIEIPVSISYHASGIKVRDIASEVGLGWVINSGGFITRTVLGQQDEFLFQGLTHKPQYMDSLQLVQDIEESQYNGTFKALSQTLFNEIRFRDGSYDSYSDRYYYHLSNGEDGMFRYDFQDNALKMVPYSPTKPIINNTTRDIEIVTTDGNHYYFKWNYLDVWYLTKIVSNNKTDSISFFSHIETMATSSRNDIGATGGTEPHLDFVDPDPHSCGYSLTILPRKVNTVSHPGGTERDEAIILFDSIVSTTTCIKMLYKQDRQDCTFEVVPPKSRMSKVQIFSRQTNSLIKEISLYQSYFGSTPNNKRLRLDSLHIGTDEIERYSFKYYPYNLPDYPDSQLKQTGECSYSEDYWGYYNGSASQNQLPYPMFPGGASKITNPTTLPTSTLQEILYPTGGRTVFEFEPNQIYPYELITSPEGYIGGLRIKQISSYANDTSEPIVKRYEYDAPVLDPPYDPVQLFSYTQIIENTFYISQKCQWLGESQDIIVFPTPLRPLPGFDGNPLVYTQVTEFLGSSNENFGKKVYSYQRPPKDIDIRFVGVDNAYVYLSPFQYDRGSYKPLLLSTMEYKYENQQYSPVKGTSTTYINLKRNRFKTGINMASTMRFFSYDNPEDELIGLQRYLDLSETAYISSIVTSNTWAYTDISLPLTVTTSDYTDGNSIITTTKSYSYNDFLQPISETIYNSNGAALRTEFKYANESASTEPYKTMVSRNTLNPIIEQIEYKDGSVVGAIRTHQKNWTSKLIAPDSIEMKKGADRYETRVQYLGYNPQGNPLGLTKDGTDTKLYLWGYKKAYPIAELISADPNIEFAYTSFEEGQDNSSLKWAIQSNNEAIVNSSSLTGNKCYDLSRALLTKSNLNPATTYTISYCYKGTEPSTGAVPHRGIVYSNLKNDWMRVSFNVTGVSSFQITGTSLIDEICIHPVGTQITTYTYEPLVGMTSTTDPNGRTTYFEYDSLGRLIRVTDAWGNIMKQYTYHEKK